MTTQNCYEGIGHVVHIRTEFDVKCEHCGELMMGDESFAKSINHYMDEHEYKLLHIGSECDLDIEGKPCHRTVAVLGK